jgi:RNA polymerase sigma-70 factor (ECF subfamily)
LRLLRVGVVLKATSTASSSVASTWLGVKRREFAEEALAHLDALYRTALRLTRNRAEAEDLVQDVYLRAFRKVHQYELGTNCRAWLFTIMRRLFLNSLRDRDREQLIDDPRSYSSAHASATAPVSGNPEIEFFDAVLSRDVDRAVRSLPLVFREAVILVYLEGFSYQEAAEVLACPVGTVMSRLSRGRHLLRRALNRDALLRRTPARELLQIADSSVQASRLNR